ncbi:MAG: hypothetical protein MRJ96_02290 [Nitrospirales bacterium]|nr:hypothetical protein [Nitrospira sp.]MDR4500273.1 hypothetical protein [Nitrospirales bacterium]
MFVWSKRLVIGLVVAFCVLELVFWLTASGGESSQLLTRTTQWIILNYVLVMVWLMVWMFDQTRVRGKNVWGWYVPFLIAPLPTLVAFILFLQRRIK